MSRRLALLVALLASSESYDPSTALRRVHDSGAAYCPQAAVEAWTCAPCLASGRALSHVTYIFNASAFASPVGYVGLDSAAGDIVIAFRGSVTVDDWLEDFDVTTVPYREGFCEGCFVHRGWSDDYDRIRAQLTAAVRALLVLAPGARVAFTGHSLGAALTELAAYDFAREGLPVASLVTFGAPRVGDSTWAAAWAAAAPKAAAFRVVHHLDPVPRLIPRFIENYTHPPQEIW